MPDFVESPLSSLLKASWQGAVLSALVLAVQRALGRRLKPEWRHGLWLLVVVRLALPWTVPSPVSIFNLVNRSGVSTAWAGPRLADGGPGWPTPTASAVAAPTEEPDEASPRPPAAPGPGLKIPWPLALWLAGAVPLALFLLATHWRLARRISRRRPFVDAAVMNLLEDCKQRMNVRVPVTLVETGAVGSPALFGFVRPRLLLPAGLASSFSTEELRHVFLHELGHLKRRDVLLGWLTTGLQILHWLSEYVESVEYANETTKEFVGKTSKFTVKIEGDTLTQIGVGNPWREVWKRANPSRQRKSDATILQGTWAGEEAGAKGSASLVVRGSTLEFHGADTNEWYKGTVAIYDTTPKQLVTTITECPFPDYTGLTAYAIYELKDGTLTVAGNEPGIPVVPSGFDASGSRKLVFKLK